jgi:ribonuclease VapC
MIIDTSAVVAILAGEQDATHYAQLIEQDPTPRIGTPTLIEASVVLTRWFGEAAEAALDAFVRESGAEIFLADLRRRNVASTNRSS